MAKQPAPLRFVLASQSITARMVRLLAASVPAAVRAWIRGPINRIEIGAAQKAPVRWPRRPVDLVVPSALMLRHRLSIPTEARRDLPHAIELFIRHDTPFAPDELVVHLEEAVGADDGSLKFEMRLVPHSVLAEVMLAHRLKAGRIGRIILAGTDLPDGAADVATLVLRRSPMRGWFFAGPLLVLVGAMGFAGAQQLSIRQQTIDLLQSRIGVTLSSVKALEGELDKQRRATTGATQVLSLVATTPSRFETLANLRRALPDGAEVLEIHAREAQTSVVLRASNVLSVAQALGPPSGSWLSTVEGAITNDPATHQEMATVALRLKGSP